MKKILLSAVVVTMSLFSFNAMAHGKQCDKKDCQKETCDKHKKCNKKVKHDCPNPFAGIELTQAQQAQLDALKASCPSKEMKKGMLPECLIRLWNAQKKSLEVLAEILVHVEPV